MGKINMSLMFNCSTKIISSIFLCLIVCSFDSIFATNLHKAKNSITTKSKSNNINLHLHNSQIVLHSTKKSNLKITHKKNHTPKEIEDTKKSNIISDQDKIILEINSKKNTDTSFTNIQRRDFYTYANLSEKCNTSNCPAPNSCASDHICRCSEDRANFDENAFGEYDRNIPQVYCNYTRKKQLIAFILEFCFISVGHFYIGSYVLGFLKLFSLISAIFIATRFEEKWSKILSTIIFSLLCIWWAIDSALFAVNFYPDSNKVLLMEW